VVGGRNIGLGRSGHGEAEEDQAAGEGVSQA